MSVGRTNQRQSSYWCGRNKIYESMRGRLPFNAWQLRSGIWSDLPKMERMCGRRIRTGNLWPRKGCTALGENGLPLNLTRGRIEGTCYLARRWSHRGRLSLSTLFLDKDYRYGLHWAQQELDGPAGGSSNIRYVLSVMGRNAG